MIREVNDQGRSSAVVSGNSRKLIDLEHILGRDKLRRLPGRIREAIRLHDLHQASPPPPEGGRNYYLEPQGQYWWLDAYAPVQKRRWQKFLGFLPPETGEWLARPMDKLLHSGTFQPDKMQELRERPGLAAKDRDPETVIRYLYYDLGIDLEPVKIWFKDRTQSSSAKAQNHIKAIYIQSPINEQEEDRQVYLYCPGRSGGIGYLSDVALNQAWLSGHDVLLLSYRGYDTTMMKHYPDQYSMADDVDAAINFLILKKQYKPENINFTACSLGADALLNALALRVKRLSAAHAKENWGKLDLRCPFKDLESIAKERVRETFPVLGRLLQYPVWAAVQNKPMNHHVHLDHVYPYVKSIDFLSNIEGEQGIEDELIPRWHTEANCQRAHDLVERSKGIEADDRYVNIDYLPDSDHWEVSTYY